MLPTLFITAVLAIAPATVSARGPATHIARLRQRALCSSELTTRFCDLKADVENCGRPGNQCTSTWENGSGAICVDGECQAERCDDGFAFDSALGGCIDILSDVINCGAVKSACSEALPNSVTQACEEGQCIPTKCKAGFSREGNVCSNRFAADPNNCGAAGVVCSASAFAHGIGAKCLNGVCAAESCKKGYFWDIPAKECRQISSIDLTKDTNHCGAIDNKCQDVYVNGGFGECVDSACRATWCNPGYSWDAKHLFCRPVNRDLNHCGAVNRLCKPEGSSGALCVAGECFASQCLHGYALRQGICEKIDITSDVAHCGALDKPCNFMPLGATGICENSHCKVTTCPEKWSFKDGLCIADPVRQRARVKKEKKKAPTFCPSKEETACPIAGSATFEAAASHHFTKPKSDFSGIMTGAGGYECVDTQVSIDSCGGCSSTGEGQDCTRIPHAMGVGCEIGVCRVFSCRAGFRPNLDGTVCVRASTEGRSPRRNHSRRAQHAHHQHAGASFRHHGAGIKASP